MLFPFSLFVLGVVFPISSNAYAQPSPVTERLMQLVSDNYLPEYLEPVIEAGADVNYATENGFTPLMVVANQMSCNPGSVQLLVDAGANLDAQESTTGYTALLFNVTQPCPEVAEILIDNGADVNIANDEGITPLMYASGSQYSAPGEEVETYQRIIDAGANLNAQDNEGRTAAVYAVKSFNWSEVVEDLVSAGADFSIRDNEGKLPIEHTPYDEAAVMDVIEGRTETD